MAVFEKGKLTVISDKGETDLSRASLNKNLSAVDYDQDGKFFFITIDKVMFGDPVSTIKTVLDAHGFVANLENVLSCLDSFVIAAYARTSGEADEGGVTRVSEYTPCLRFELPQKNKVGDILQSFYDEIAKYEARVGGDKTSQWSPNPEVKALKDLKTELADLKSENSELREQVSQLTQQLSREQKSLSRASRALDSQQLLPDNARIGRVDRVDLKRRLVYVKCNRKVIEVPTHMLDRVPEYQARCLITLDEDGDSPIGVVFLDNLEWKDLEKRTAELLFVEGDSFKARDSKRNEFQIKAVNDLEADTIAGLRRGMKIIISIADGFVVRFSVLGATLAEQFISHIREQIIVHDLARNQLVAVRSAGDSE
jgi:hypothetical protein